MTDAPASAHAPLATAHHPSLPPHTDRAVTAPEGHLDPAQPRKDLAAP
ncbi:hypothetical protein GCM10018785_30450 [Streptomyces longispororuber]|uniref:Uncharacterized protein n=1 Tax=Streptomyces longispororuber TaxID=68230 RepID=A0A918ZMI8_9ACTN|nr:hypothetical protein [Streptomyces longispororuber]GHE59098.1 hypothetical protein GCM10018785_30450 [Streptomyces longispororuber]